VHTTGIGQYWHKITDPTFRGIYHVNAFDLAMMIPYFLVLFVLATYGLHRYWLVYDYYKYARNIPGRRRKSRIGRASPCSFPSSMSAT